MAHQFYPMRLFPGLLVSCRRSQEHLASSEISHALREEVGLELEEIRVRHTGTDGLVTVGLSESRDYHQITKQLMDLEGENRYFADCLKIRPIDFVVENVEEMVEGIKSLDITREGSYRVTVEKRFTGLTSEEVISPLAEIFDKQHDVDLEYPDWEILVEIVGEWIGYSILSPQLVYSTQIAYEQE